MTSVEQTTQQAQQTTQQTALTGGAMYNFTTTQVDAILGLLDCGPKGLAAANKGNDEAYKDIGYARKMHKDIVNALGSPVEPVSVSVPVSGDCSISADEWMERMDAHKEEIAVHEDNYSSLLKRCADTEDQMKEYRAMHKQCEKDLFKQQDENLELIRKVEKLEEANKALRKALASNTYVGGVIVKDSSSPEYTVATGKLYPWCEEKAETPIEVTVEDNSLDMVTPWDDLPATKEEDTQEAAPSKTALKKQAKYLARKEKRTAARKERRANKAANKVEAEANKKPVLTYNMCRVGTSNGIKKATLAKYGFKVYSKKAKEVFVGILSDHYDVSYIQKDFGTDYVQDVALVFVASQYIQAEYEKTGGTIDFEYVSDFLVDAVSMAEALSMCKEEEKFQEKAINAEYMLHCDHPVFPVMNKVDVVKHVRAETGCSFLDANTAVNNNEDKFEKAINGGHSIAEAYDIVVDYAVEEVETTLGKL